MKVRSICLFLLLAALPAYGQNDAARFIDDLLGKWVSVDSIDHTLEIKRDDKMLLFKESATDETGRPFVTVSRLYLDGRLQTDDLKAGAAEARTEVESSRLTTTFYALRDGGGGVRQLFKERLSIKNGRLVRAAQIKIGVPFLAAGTKQVFRKITE